MRATALSGDRKHLAVAGGRSGAGQMQLRDAVTGDPTSPLITARNTVASVAFSPDGQVLITGGTDRTAQLWAVPSGSAVGPALSHHASVFAAAFAPDGRHFATAEDGGAVRVWSPPAGQTWRVPLAGEHSFGRVCREGPFALPSGMSETRAALTATQVIDLADGRPTGATLQPGGVILGGDFAPDGVRVALLSGRAGSRPRVHLFDWRSGAASFAPVELSSEPRWMDFRPDGRRLAVICASGELVVIDTADGRVTHRWAARPESTNSSHYITGNGAVGYSPDGRRLVVWGTTPLAARVFDADSGAQLFELSHDSICHGVRFSADGTQIATASFDKTARLWDAATGEPNGEPLVHPDWVFDAVFSPDGRRLLTTCRDGMARVWSLAERRPVAPPMAHGDEILPAAFTPDGRWVVTASMDRTARVWDWRTGKPMSPPLPLANGGLSVAVAGDGRRVVVGGFGPALEVINLDDLSAPETRSPQEVCTWAELVAGQRIESGGVTNLTAGEWLDRWRTARQNPSTREE